jgi:hypothetical protein
MKKEFIEKAEQKIKRYICYIVKCDDKNSPVEVKPDAFFRLWEFEKLSKYIQLCENHNLKYDLVIQEFNTEDDSVEYEIDIVSKNWENN